MEVKRHFASFAEAIREGAQIRPQGIKSFFSGGQSCAAGAGLEALFGAGRASEVERVYPLYPYLENDCPSCPVDKCYTGKVSGESVMTMIYHLNDFHRWSREQIADWLETIEEAVGFVTVVETEALKIPEAGLTTEHVPNEAYALCNGS